ncbi:Fic family protein [Bacillus sp. MUM 13]|uniref:Fic family protein n=1 Tax=Bacillus sp. MUM 13 TaxID=1678001 RepID=UPI0008F55B37|nr:Fic family protein [Bacillus sp. MUM 13]OIK06469.1 hypothetical protein BIV59_21495 [Bacillus sp. MUM 13]
MSDIYVYKGTNVLIKSLHIKDPDVLELAEKEITTVRLRHISKGILTEGFYDVDHYRQFHRYIFGDIYPWAGSLRTINIFKNERELNGYPLEFVDHDIVESHLNWIFTRMNELPWASFSDNEGAHHLARVMSEIWRAHALREYKNDDYLYK